MSGGSTTIPAAELAAAAADYKPLLAASNALEVSYAPYSQAKWSADGTWSDPDITHSYYPARRAYDRALGFPTKSNNQAVSETWLLFSLDVAKEFDLVMIAGHNFGDLCAAGVLVSVSVADDQDFTANVLPVAAFGAITPVVTNKRLIKLSLGGGAGNQRFVGSPYGRVKIETSDVSNFLEPPAIGEVFFGRRRQMLSRPWTGFAPSQLRSERGNFESKSGNNSSYGRVDGRVVVGADFVCDAVDAASARTCFEEARNGLDPILWIENASIAATDYTPRPAWVLAPPELALPTAGPLVQGWRLDALEVSPTLKSEE